LQRKNIAHFDGICGYLVGCGVAAGRVFVPTPQEKQTKSLFTSKVYFWKYL
jgi:hypothetical protein